jgi:hypothetical protein
MGRINMRSAAISAFGVALLFLSAANANAGFVTIDSDGDTGTLDASLGGDGLLLGFDNVVHGVGNSKVFLTVQNNGAEKGYNTEGVTQFDTTPSGTTALPLSEVPLVSIGGTLYREFGLTVNQTGGNPTISLNQIQLFLGATGTQTGYSAGLGTQIWNWESSATESLTVKDYTPGQSDLELLLFVPNSVFTGPNQFVYLYMEAGMPAGSNDGPEKWVVAETGSFCPTDFCDEVPLPDGGSTMTLLGSALIGLGLLRRRFGRS